MFRIVYAGRVEIEGDSGGIDGEPGHAVIIRTKGLELDTSNGTQRNDYLLSWDLQCHENLCTITIFGCQHRQI